MNAHASVSERLDATGTGNAIELRGLSKYFGALAALSDITVSVKPGERRAILGSNGAGKTTLFNCITGWMQSVFFCTNWMFGDVALFFFIKR